MQPAFNPRPKKQSKTGTIKANKHQNEKAFKVKYYDHLIELKEKADLGRLCQSCYPKVQWKIQFGKYKPRTQPGKCNLCERKTLTKAYRHYCDACCDEKALCSKCGLSVKDVPPAEGEEAGVAKGGYHEESHAKKTPQEQSHEDNIFRACLPRLQERSRRKVMRLRQEGKVTIKDDKFWNTEHDREVSLLHFKKDPLGEDGDDEDFEDDDDDDFGGMDFDDDDDDFEDDDSDDAPKKKGGNKQNNKKK